MNKYIKTGLISAFLLTSVATANAADFCPSGGTCQSVWKTPATPADLGGTHGRP